MPPAFVPYFSAMTVIIMTISADKINGIADWKRTLSMGGDRIKL